MAETIRFDTGVKEFTLNDAVTVRFCPTDMNFVETVYRAIEALDAKQEEYQQTLSKLDNGAEVFDFARKIDAEIREEINAVFGTDVCTPVFGAMSVYSIADGFPVWANLLFAIIDMFDGEFAEQKKKRNPRIQKYVDKYNASAKRR